MGNARPDASKVRAPDGSTRETVPMKGCGNPVAGLISSTYIRPWLSKVNPKTEVNPGVSTLLLPDGLVL